MKNNRKVFEKGLTPWDDFAKDCILGSYQGQDAESIADKKIVIHPATDTSPETTITKSQQLGKLLERGNTQKLTDLEVFGFMDQLRREMQTA